MNDRRVDATQGPAEERLGLVIRTVLIGVAALALVGVALPSTWGAPIESVAVGLVIAIPFGRIIWLVSRWWKQGDVRFVRWAFLLLALVAVGPVLAILGR